MTNTVQKSLDMMGNNSTTAVPQTNSKTVMKNAIQDMVKSLELIEVEREHINEIAKSLKSNHNVKPKVSKKVANLIHKNKEVDVEFESEVQRLLSSVKQ